MNAIIFQVRPSTDAVYASPIEPWSNISPAQWAGRQCRLMIRLRSPSRKRTNAGWNCTRGSIPFGRGIRNQITRCVEPHFADASRIGSQIRRPVWLDPGEPAVREYVLRVVMDVVQRYDVDGVQFDDYFYPFPEKDAAGRELDFPDDSTWQRFGFPSGFEP